MLIVRDWARQPTTVTGVAAISGTLFALVVHQMTWAQAAPLIVGAIISIALPDDASAKPDGESITKAIVEKLAGKPPATP